jgi:hypothetical protein
MQLKMSPNQPRIEGAMTSISGTKIYAQFFDRGDPVPKRTTSFDIFVSNEGRSKSITGFKRVIMKNWQKIGQVKFDRCVASYNGESFHPLSSPSLAYQSERSRHHGAGRWEAGGRIACTHSRRSGHRINSLQIQSQRLGESD